MARNGHETFWVAPSSLHDGLATHRRAKLERHSTHATATAIASSTTLTGRARVICSSLSAVQRHTLPKSESFGPRYISGDAGTLLYTSGRFRRATSRLEVRQRCRQHPLRPVVGCCTRLHCLCSLRGCPRFISGDAGILSGQVSRRLVPLLCSADCARARCSPPSNDLVRSANAQYRDKATLGVLVPSPTPRS